MMEWFRWYHGACSDAKWPIIARKAGVSVGVVVSVWAALLEYASQDEERGSVAGFDGETYDALYGYEDGTCDAVLAAMIEKGLICDGCICAWGKRQQEGERDERGRSSTERVRRFREKQRKTSNESTFNNNETHSETLCNADETPSETLCNADETHETYKNRTEKRREDINTPPTQEYFNNLNTRARALNTSGGGEERTDGVWGEADTAPGVARQEIASEQDHGPARTDAPSKGTPEWTAFLSCWDVYPVKQGQEEAWREWMRLKRNATLEAAWVIREAILTMCAEDSRWQRGKVPKFARWLNGKGWNDMPYVEPGHDAPLRDGTGGMSGGEPVARTEYQRQRQCSRKIAAALLAGRRDSGFMATGTERSAGGVYETTAFATAGGNVDCLRARAIA